MDHSAEGPEADGVETLLVEGPALGRTPLIGVELDRIGDKRLGQGAQQHLPACDQD